MDSYRVLDQEHGFSLLTFLSQKNKGTYSAKKIKEAIISKHCTVNGKLEFFPSRRLAAGDLVTLMEIEQKVQDDIAILFQDAHYAVVSKPAGVVCSSSEFQKRLPHEVKWRLVHRLDKETSGLVILAKTSLAEEAIKKLFLQRAIRKLYLAIVDGSFLQKEKLVENFLGIKGGYAGQTIYGSTAKGEGLLAITFIKRLSLGEKSSLLLCIPKTGRTHQIRVHVSEEGHPILGDAQYAKKEFLCPFRAKRHLLHAWKLSFIHPITHKEMEFTAEVPQDFLSALQSLKIPFSGAPTL
jgi:RluA family pseudouridine synthase